MKLGAMVYVMEFKASSNMFVICILLRKKNQSKIYCKIFHNNNKNNNNKKVVQIVLFCKCQP